MTSAVGEFWDASALRVGVETNGLQGGDAGHGGWAEVQVRFLTGDSFETPDGGHTEEILIKVSGDSEISTLAAALEWAGAQLKELAGARSVPVQQPSD
ncbi:hypothetical protein [Streptomyces sp. SMS_SU21]|uniref:hypothetical protein n=1 Tax=Streptomyces sp. SMS_SU21 TaxID=2069440 RepID=UPI0011B73BC0|nr:hypothetical protein [Streptomyces sp. SMS_SU21]MCA2204013.1 hypothetical protein [Streptomyces sp. SMS_SU21]